MKNWPSALTKQEAIQILESLTDQDDPYWENAVEEFYDSETDTMPSIYHVLSALGVTESEYKEATNAPNVNWPSAV